jgi:(2Fe-2S) ferredoxin
VWPVDVAFGGTHLLEGDTVPGRRAARRDTTAREITGCTVTVCRGCCCGTVGKHPDVDHAGQVEALRVGIGDAGRVRVSDCLDACERSNVMVVGPSPDGRRAGAKPTWLAGVLHPDTVGDVVEWVRAGGPGVEDPPGILDLSTFAPSRKQRQEAGEL